MRVCTLATVAALLVTVHSVIAGVNAANRIILVTNTAELYQQAEDPENRGARLIVRAGLYEISRPLRLRQGMELVGENQYRDVDRDGIWDLAPGGGWVIGDETVLDARTMTTVSGSTGDCNNGGGIQTTNPEPAIVVGGNNWVRGVTIRAPPAGIGIGESFNPRGDLPEDDDLVGRTGIEFGVEDTVIVGGIRGVTLSNRGCASSQFSSSLVFGRNVIIGTGTGIGLTLANFATDNGGLVDGPSISAQVRQNRFVGYDFGLSVIGAAQGTDGGAVELFSIRNRFEDNATGGMTIRAAVSQAVPEAPSSNGNSVRFFSIDDTFHGNGSPALGSQAILLTGSERLTDASGVLSGGENHDNHIEAHVINARIDGPAPGLRAIGGRFMGNDPNKISGTGNVVTLLVRAAEGNPPILETFDNSPPRAFAIEPPNYVELIGSETGLVR